MDKKTLTINFFFEIFNVFGTYFITGTGIKKTFRLFGSVKLLQALFCQTQ